MHLKLVPRTNKLFVNSAASVTGGQQERFKLVIEKAVHRNWTKDLISDARLAHTAIFERGKSASIPHQRGKVKHLSSPQNTKSNNFENVFTVNLPDLVVVRLLADADISGHYNKNPFNYQDFGETRIKLKRNGISLPSQGYTLHYADKRYYKNYETFQEQLGLYVHDKCVILTQFE